MSLVRFDIRPDEQGWTIFDRETYKPASVEGHEAVGLSREDADEIADLLRLSRAKRVSADLRLIKVAVTRRLGCGQSVNRPRFALRAFRSTTIVVADG